MGSSPSQQKIYRAAVAGIPRVVQAISELPSRHHAEALAAAGRGYWQTIVDSGIAEPTADRMVATLLRRLQNRLAKERSVKDKVMRALQEALIDPPPDTVEKKRTPKRKTPRRRTPKRTPRTESPPVQDELEADLPPIQKSPTTSPE
jgi:cellulose biosynthesis protein BcsQ